MILPSVLRRPRVTDATVAVVILATLGALASMARRTHAPQRADSSIGALDGWTVRGLRHTSRVGDSTVLGISAEETSLSRVRLGLFRIGFAWQLFVKNARVELDVGSGRLRRSIPLALDGHGHAGAVPQRLISGVYADGLEIRLEDRGGAWVELSADRCEAGLWDGGRVVFHGNVRLTSDLSRRTFARLVYDLASHRFVEAHGVRGRGRSQTTELEPMALEDVNAIVRRVGDIDVETLRSHFMRLSFGS